VERSRAASPDKERDSGGPRPAPQKKPREQPKVPQTPRPDDLVRPAPNEPVRIQPPAPKFAHGYRAPADANRWVRQRQNEPRGALWQTHGHSSMRGR
jgi:hypothetical protein